MPVMGRASVGVGTFPVSRMEEQTQEEVAREKPGWEEWCSGPTESMTPALTCVLVGLGRLHLGPWGGGGAGVCVRATYSSNFGIGIPEVEKK